MKAISCKESVHEPARPRRFAIEKPFAKEPESLAFAILGTEVIAGEGGLVLPPFGRDPLRSFNRGDFVHDAPPAKTQRGPVRYAGNGLDRLWMLQQTDGTLSQSFLNPIGICLEIVRGWLLQVISPARSIALSRRHGGDGEFRYMRVIEGKPRHPPQSQSRAEPVDEGGEIGGLIHARRCVPACLFLILALDRERGETNDVETEACVEWIGFIRLAYGFDTLAKKSRYGLWIAQGPARASLDMLRHAIDAKEVDFETSCAFAMAREHQGEILRKRGDCRLNILAPHYTIEKAPFCHIGGGFKARRYCAFGQALQGVEPGVKGA